MPTPLGPFKLSGATVPSPLQELWVCLEQWPPQFRDLSCENCLRCIPTILGHTVMDTQCFKPKEDTRAHQIPRLK